MNNTEKMADMFLLHVVDQILVQSIDSTWPGVIFCRKGIMQTCREFKTLFDEARERASKALGFAKMLMKVCGMVFRLFIVPWIDAPT